MSATVYEGNIYNDIHTKEVLVGQLEKALADLKANESNLIRVEFAGLAIEIDRNDSSLWVIA